MTSPLLDGSGDAIPKRGKMRGRYFGSVWAGGLRKRKHRRKGDRRRCTRSECLHQTASRASEKAAKL